MEGGRHAFAWERKPGWYIYAQTQMGKLSQQPMARLEILDPDPPPFPPHRPPGHIPNEAVDLLYVDATGGAVSECQGN